MTEPNPVQLMLQKTQDQSEHIAGLLIGAVRKDGTTVMHYTASLTPAMLAHLSRILDVKINREYTDTLFPNAPIVRAPAVHAAKVPDSKSQPVVAPKQRRKRSNKQ